MTRQDHCQAQAPPAGHHGRGRPGCHGRTRTQSLATGPAVATAAAGRPGRKLEISFRRGGIRVRLGCKKMNPNPMKDLIHPVKKREVGKKKSTTRCVFHSNIFQSTVLK
jgi:hypothetical protein